MAEPQSLPYLQQRLSYSSSSDSNENHRHRPSHDEWRRGRWLPLLSKLRHSGVGWDVTVHITTDNFGYNDTSLQWQSATVNVFCPKKDLLHWKSSDTVQYPWHFIGISQKGTKFKGFVVKKSNISCMGSCYSDIYWWKSFQSPRQKIWSTP